MLIAAILLIAVSGCRAPFGGGASVTVVNGSEEPICDLLISPADEDYWGSDWLADGETIAPGARRVIELAPGEYDLMALGCEQTEIDTLWGQAIDGPFIWTVEG
ncbi:MAG: hypothetical protein Kow00124_16310 [Anaerolineae bacterium]